MTAARVLLPVQIDGLTHYIRRAGLWASQLGTARVDDVMGASKLGDTCC